MTNMVFSVKILRRIHFQAINKIWNCSRRRKRTRNVRPKIRSCSRTRSWQQQQNSLSVFKITVGCRKFPWGQAGRTRPQSRTSLKCPQSKRKFSDRLHCNRRICRTVRWKCAWKSAQKVFRIQRREIEKTCEKKAIGSRFKNRWARGRAPEISWGKAEHQTGRRGHWVALKMRDCNRRCSPVQKIIYIVACSVDTALAAVPAQRRRAARSRMISNQIIFESALQASDECSFAYVNLTSMTVVPNQISFVFRFPFCVLFERFCAIRCTEISTKIIDVEHCKTCKVLRFRIDFTNIVIPTNYLHTFQKDDRMT